MMIVLGFDNIAMRKNSTPESSEYCNPREVGLLDLIVSSAPPKKPVMMHQCHYA